MSPDENTLLATVGLANAPTSWLDISIPLPLRKKSSCIASASYVIASRTLTINFTHGNSVAYHSGIPTALGLIAAESPGAFYNAHIRGQAEL